MVDVPGMHAARIAFTICVESEWVSGWATAIVSGSRMRTPGAVERAADRKARALTVSSCATVAIMAKSSSRVNVMLDEEHATKLRRLAERTHTNPGTIARSLLSSALEEADPDPRNVTELLDRIDGAFERAQRGKDEMRRGLGTSLEDL